MHKQASIVFISTILLVLSAVSGYSVVGNKIYDPNGNPILLRGFARPSLEWSNVGERLSLADYQLMKNWGANSVRIALNQCFWLAGHAGYDANYKATVDQQVKWIKSLGMAVILDLHWNDKGNMGLASCGQQNMADVNSVTFWSQLAAIYKNDPMIIFELYNEPHDVSWKSWLSGGTDGGFTSVGMQQLYDAVRATGANNAVIVNGLNWAFDLSGVANYPVVGNNIIYGTHPYDYAGKQVEDYANAFGFLAAKYPLIATEFGEYNCNPVYNQAFVNYANSLSISWCAWAWYPNGCAFPSAIADWSGTPSVAGGPVQRDLKCTNKVPGATTNLCSGSDSGSKPNTGATSAPTPTTTPATAPPSGSAISIYTDSLQNGFSDWTWSTTKNAADGSKVHGGSSSYSFAPQAYQAVWFVKTGAIDTSLYAGIEFYYLTTGSENVHFNLVKGSTNGGSKVGIDMTVAAWSGASVLPANTWIRVYVDLSQFPAGQYDGFWFQDQSGASSTTVRVYIDDVKMYAAGSSTPATQAPSTQAPSTQAPSTQAPTSKPTQAPSTPSPTSKPTPSPATPSPATSAPSPSSGGAALKVQIHSGASAYWFAIALTNGNNAASVQMKDSAGVTSYTAFQTTNWGYYIFPSQPNPLTAPFNVRITSTTGRTITFVIPTLTPGAVIDSGVPL